MRGTRIDATDPALRYFTRHPRGSYLHIVRGHGVYLYAADGRAILDGASGAAVACLGHGHERIVQRLAAQAQTIAFAHTSAFVTTPVLELAERLAGYAGDAKARVYFVSGGSEAIETALKIARAYQLAVGQPSRHRIVSRAISYHGATMGALATTGLQLRRTPYEPLLAPLPKVATCYCYRCPVGREPHLCDVECADDLPALLAHDAEQTAAFILEPVIGSAAPGVSAPREYITRVAAACRRHGVLLIADEVMSGVGRTGRFFAMDHYGVAPDITALSKGISGGYFPLAAVIVAGHVFEAIQNHGSGDFVHGFTYAGNPLGAAVGLEVLDILEEQQLVPRVAELGDLLLTRLPSLQQLPMIGDVRGKGLLIGVELVMDRLTRQPFPQTARAGRLVLQACLEEGLAVYPSSGSVNGVMGDSLLLAPPYIITPEQIDELVNKLGAALERARPLLLQAAEAAAPCAPTVTGHE